MSASPQTLSIPATDGYPLGARLWQPAAAAVSVVVVNAATSVDSRYYGRFAAWLQAQGHTVLTYDYRGIGASRRGSLRGLSAGWLDWGEKDFEGVLRWAVRHAGSAPVQVVGHSIGGALLGLAPSNARIARAVTVGAQFAYWRDYQRAKRLGMLLRWHLFMPALTALCGYFPGQRLGWLEDTPKGVVHDWITPAQHFEDTFAHRPGWKGPQAAHRQALRDRFAALQAELLAIHPTDDEYATPAAVDRLLAAWPHCRATCLPIAPSSAGVPAIGHFAFFHSRFQDTLWPLVARWLAPTGHEGGQPA